MNKSKIIKDLLNKEILDKDALSFLLQTDKTHANLIFEKAAEIKQQYVGNTTYLRGLIELSNICRKNCLYCGIRKGNTSVERYNLTDEAVVEAAKYAYEKNYASIVIQSGELDNEKFTNRITRLLKKINAATNHKLGITLSMGEQSEAVFKEWKANNVSRYLLRIESSDKELYNSIHPNDETHSFENRIKALRSLQNLGYQTGTGVMIGLPGQTYEHLAGDLLFFQNFDIDMVGMGPYISHSETPMANLENRLSLSERFFLALKMTALLRILMKDINIAAATALQAIDPAGREKAIKCGANVLMPNLTPSQNRNNYRLYENKPCIDESAEDCIHCTEARISLAGDEIGYGEQGNSKHFYKRTDKQGQSHS
jgi:biotin synthase